MYVNLVNRDLSHYFRVTDKAGTCGKLIEMSSLQARGEISREPVRGFTDFVDATRQIGVIIFAGPSLLRALFLRPGGPVLHDGQSVGSVLARQVRSFQFERKVDPAKQNA